FRLRRRERRFDARQRAETGVQIGYALEWQVRIFKGIADQGDISGDFRDLCGHIFYKKMGTHREARFVTAHTRTAPAHEHKACRAHAQIVAFGWLISRYNQEQTSAFSNV